MALFGSSKPKTKGSIVKPTVVRTQNVAREMQGIATTHGVDVSSLEFNILETFTYMRTADDKEAEWESVDNNELYDLDDTQALLNPQFELKQTYEIEVFSSSSFENKFPDLKLAVGANASKCKVYMSISQGSKIEDMPDLHEELTTYINKRKVRAGILIYIFDEMLRDVVSKLSAQAKVEESVSFATKETLLIAESFEPTPTRNDALILHYENAKKEIDEHDRIDYAARGFIQSVQEGELLIEYIKPKKGEPGRNCRGEYLAPAEPIVANEVTFAIDSTIRQEEDENSVKYIAKEKGYIAFQENTYTIKKEMEIDEISFKKTGSVLSGVHSDVNLSVNEKDAHKDAVGSGMQVEVSEIEVDGNVGSNAHIVALKAKIGGQTHRTSFVKADDLDINIHKGKALGKSVHITRLEHGDVEGESVKVTQALGGHIRGREVDVELCASHVTLTATKRIEVQKLQGSENCFIIDPLLKKDVQESLHDNEKIIDELKLSVKNLKEEIYKLQESIKKGTPAFLDIKKRLVHYKKNGVKLPSAFVQKYKAFMQLQDELKELKSEYSTKNDNLQLHKTRTSSFQDNILDARVINRDRWVGYNEIKFKLVDPPMELVHKPAEGSKDMIFGLIEDEEGEYSIKAMKE